MTLTKRNILTLGAVGLGVAAVAQVAPMLIPASAFEFTPLDSPAGFRRIARGDGLSGGRFLVGLDDPETRPDLLTEDQICRLVHGGRPTGPGHLAIAVFSDFFCPYCRVLDLEVRALAARDDRIEVVPHEVPLLGVPSEFAARAVIAAHQQGAYEAFHARLIRTNFVPNPAYLRGIAEAEGLDVKSFSTDMRSPETEQQLINAMGLFRAFGFVGTPGLAVGRTLVNGAISQRDLKALIKLELAEDTAMACR